MWKEALGLLAAAGIGIPAARAQATSEHSLAQGRQLLESCQSSASTVRAMCLGYLAAITDDIWHHEAAGPASERSACLPPATSVEAYREVFVAFATTHPETLEKPSLPVVKTALATRWPCP